MAAAALIVCAALANGAAADAGRAGSGVGASRLVAKAQAHPGHDPGGRIAWSQFVDLDFNGSRIVSSDPNGHRPRRLTDPASDVYDVDPQVSPNGRLVAYERDIPDPTYGYVSTLGIVGADGRGERALDVGCVDPCVGTNQPTWTPDGRHLIFERVIGPIDSQGNAVSAALWQTDLEGEHLRRITPSWVDGRFEDTWAQFAPGGYLVLARLRLATDTIAIFRMNPDGTGACRLTPWRLNADLPDVSPATTGPTKDLAVFETHGHGEAPPGISSAVATTRAVCGGPHPIRYLTSPKALPVSNFNPSWSPDGRQVAYVRFKYLDSDPIVHGDIWRMRWNGEGKRPVSQLDLFEYRPNWGPTPDDDND